MPFSLLKYLKFWVSTKTRHEGVNGGGAPVLATSGDQATHSLTTGQISGEVDIRLAKAIVGRRLGAKDFRMDGDKPIPLVEAFLDSRLKTDLSFDALGYSGNQERKIVAQVAPIARRHIGASFWGWAGFRRDSLPFPVTLVEPVNTEANEHHCELSRESYRDKVASLSLAHHLVAIARDQNRMIPAPPTLGSTPAGAPPPSQI
jgi:hypothetical protein